MPHWRVRHSGSRLDIEHKMKLLILLFGLTAAAAIAPPAGYKPYGKYIYNYTAGVEVALGPDREQYTSLKINATVEFHFLPNYEVLLWIPKTSISDVVLDPKYSFHPNVTESPHANLISKYLEIPIKFGYRNGLVNRIYNRAEDPMWSVNMKKGIVNLMHVDVTGKDEETGDKALFTKEEMSVYGICNTTYTMKDYSVFDVNRMVKIGMNITKAIDTTNCTMQPMEQRSTIAVPPRDTKMNPFTTTTWINYNLIGNEFRFKLQQVNASGRFVFVPFGEKEGSVVAATWQILTYKSSGASTVKRDHPSWLELPIYSTLIVPIEKKPVVVQEIDATFRKNMVKSIHDLVFTIANELEEDVTRDRPLNISTPEIFLRLVNYLRIADEEVLESVWTHCQSQEKLKRWFVYSLSVTGNETSLHFIEKKILNKEIPLKLVSEILPNFGYVSNPSLSLLKEVKKLCSLKMFTEDTYLNQTCLVVISNILKSYCEMAKHCNAEIDSESPSITSFLEHIVNCDPKTMTCWTEVQMMPVLVATENLGFMSYYPHLKKIVTGRHYPLAIRAKAITSLRKIIFANPTHVRLLLFRLFRDISEEVELRSLAFDVLMENPTPNLIKLCATTIIDPSNEVRSFVFTKINSILTAKMPHEIGKDIYAALIISKNLYLGNVERVIARSQHKLYKWNNFVTNMYLLGYKTSLFTNSSYMPRYTRTGLNVTLLGKTFTFFDTEIRIEGLQDFLNNISFSSFKSKKGSFMDYLVTPSPTEVPAGTDDLKNLNAKLPVKPRVDEKLKLFMSIKNYGKVIYFNYSTFEMNMDWKEYLLKGALFRLASMETEYKNGKVFKIEKPSIPVEVVYSIPTHVGIPLTLNTTIVSVMKYTSKVKAEVKPSLFSPRSLMTKERESFSSNLANNVSGVWQSLASMYFKLPLVEVGIRVNNTMNVTVCAVTDVSFDFKTKEFKVNHHLPKTNYSIVSYKTELYNYIRPEALPHSETPELYRMKKYNFTLDHDTTIQIFNGTQTLNSTSRHAVWSLKMADSKYLCVVNSIVTTCDKPYFLHVVFHGPHRRLVSLYAPGHGFITMSHKSTCLFIKPKLTKEYSKLFIIDYITPNEIRLKTLVRMPKQHWPSQWHKSTVQDYLHLKEVEELYMREHVAMEKEDLVEEVMDPKDLFVRVVFLKTIVNKVCITPKIVEATPYKFFVDKTVEDVIRNISMSTGYCTRDAWGVTFCLHGYHSGMYGTPYLHKLLAPVDLSVWIHKNITNSPESIAITYTPIDKKWESLKYKWVLELVGTMPLRTIVGYTHLTRSLEERKLAVVVQPSHEELLSFKKMCFSFISNADTFRARASMHPTCEVPHFKFDVVTSEVLPRHWLTLRLNYTYEQLPVAWQRIFNVTSDAFKYIMAKQSTYFYPVNNTNVTGTNSTHFTWFLTSPRSMDFTMKTEHLTFATKDIRLPYEVRTFPKGSKTTHLAMKLSKELMTPYCLHKNSTFTTFDGVKYDYNLSSGCEHVLIRNCSANITNFAVLVKRHPIHPRMRSITILVDTYKVEVIPKEITLPPTFKVNGKEMQLEGLFYMIKKSPQSTTPLFKFKWEPELHNFIIKYYEGLDLVVELREGWKIKTRVTPSLTSKTCGLCGDYNMEQTDEFKTPEQYVTSDPKLFGYSWIVPGEKCVTGCSMSTDFVDITNKATLERRMLCLTKFRLPICLPTCKVKETATVRIPTVCVPKSYTEILRNSLVYGKDITINSAEHYEMNVKYPLSCDCPCSKNKYPTTKSSMKGFEEYFTGLFFDY